MRDPKRIKRIMEKVTKIWASESDNDLRFFQFVEYLEQMTKLKFGLDDLFYLEDDEFETFLNTEFPNV